MTTLGKASVRREHGQWVARLADRAIVAVAETFDGAVEGLRRYVAPELPPTDEHPLDPLGLHVGARNSLWRAGYTTVDQVLEADPLDLKDVRNVGQAALSKIATERRGRERGPGRYAHGTRAGYMRHLRMGERACPSCRRANTLESTIRREATKTLIARHEAEFDALINAEKMRRAAS